jgi:hypothetical protein
MKQDYRLKKVAGLDKIQIIESANQLAEQIIDEGDILKAMIDIKKLSEYIKVIKDKLSDEAVMEAGKHTGNKNLEFLFSNALLRVQSRGRYDYSTCGDKIWDRLSKELKDRQEFLKGIKEEISVNDTGTGEVFSIMPPVKSGKDGLNVKLL